MFESAAGSLLVARPEIDDPHFRRAVVYLVDHSDEGAFGLVINRPTGIELGDYLEFPFPVTSGPTVFFEGGPVDDSAVVALGSEGYEPPRLLDIDAMLSGRLAPPTRIRFFAGYSGWASGQLEAELLSDSWFVVPVHRSDGGDDDVFGARSADLWRAVLRRQPPPLAALALYPDDLTTN